jgi:hypothetical protein
MSKKESFVRLVMFRFLKIQGFTNALKIRGAHASLATGMDMAP